MFGDLPSLILLMLCCNDCLANGQLLVQDSTLLCLLGSRSSGNIYASARRASKKGGNSCAPHLKPFTSTLIRVLLQLLSPPSATILAGSHHPPTTTAVTILADNHRSKFILRICGTNFESLVESNKFVEALRTMPLAYPDLCTQLFEGSTCNGFESWGPSSTLPHPFEEVLYNTSNGLEDVDLTAMGTTTVVKRKDRESVNSSLIEIKDNINEMAKVFIEKHKASNDIEACMAKLESMGWDVLDAKYQTAILLFGESVDLRKVWLLLNPLACEPWVNNAGAKYGLF
ncbi:hypothetical protein R6Q57_012049 [Mikania cordata]